MRLDISMEELFPVPVERVWHALTDLHMINRWLMQTDDFRAEVGARFILRHEPRPGVRGYVECEVLELAPPHRMVWSWVSDESATPTRLVIELEAHGQATRLTLRHTGDVTERTVTGTRAGWIQKLGELAALLAAPDWSPNHHLPRRQQMEAALHTVRFPGETEEYRRAREELLEREIELRRLEEAVAAQRRDLPLGGEAPTDYEFEESTGPDGKRTVRLSELFEDGKDTLLLYSFMFIPGEAGLPLEGGCPACTSIIDAVDGEAPHITQRLNLAVAAKAPIEQFREHARARGWRNARLLSSANSTYNHDYHAESPNLKQDPIATVFVRRNGKIHHSWSSELYFAGSEPGEHPRHVDFMWPLWKVFDLTPEGRGDDWHPRLEYS